jgi:hypothetical protein
MTDLTALAHERLRDTDLTVGELIAGLEAMLAERSASPQWPGQLVAPDLKALLEEMKRTLWTPPLGTPPSGVLLREDRDR